MPTQEERLATVEYGFKSFRTETVKAYQDMAIEVTVSKGLTEDSVRRVINLDRVMNGRFDVVEQRIDGLEFRLDRVEQDIREIKTVQSEHTSLLRQILERLPK